MCHVHVPPSFCGGPDGGDSHAPVPHLPTCCYLERCELRRLLPNCQLRKASGTEISNPPRHEGAPVSLDTWDNSGDALLHCLSAFLCARWHSVPLCSMRDPIVRPIWHLGELESSLVCGFGNVCPSFGARPWQAGCESSEHSVIQGHRTAGSQTKGSPEGDPPQQNKSMH